MPGFFQAISTRAPYSSTTGHRNAERGNAAVELLGTALQSFNPALVLPQTLAQTLISAYSIFRNDTHISEKIIHFIQMGLAASQLGLGIKLLFDSATCTSASTTICQAVYLTQLLYKGTLLVGWLPSEFSKDPYVDEPAPVARAAPAPQPLLESPSSPAQRANRARRNRPRNQSAANEATLAANAVIRTDTRPEDERIEMVPMDPSESVFEMKN